MFERHKLAHFFLVISRSQFFLWNHSFQGA